MARIVNKEDILQNILFPFNILMARIENPIPTHIHDFFELGFVLKGKGSQLINGRKHDIKEGDVFLLKRSDSHHVIDYKGLEMCYIQFDEEYFFPLWEDLKSIKGFQNLFVLQPLQNQDIKGKETMSLLPDDLEYCRQLIKELVFEYHQNLPGSQTKIIALFSIIIVFLSRKYDEVKLPNTGYLRITDAVIYMEQYYHQPITIKILAERSQLSASAFCRIFQKAYNISPLQYLQSIRMDRACRLMKNKSYSLTDIAIKTGFADLNYFSRKFRQIKGITPSAYRIKLS